MPHGLKDYYVQVPTNSSYEEVLDILEAKGILKDRQAFTLLAERMKYKRNPMRAGRYELQPGWSLIQLIRHLRGGKPQAPVDVVLTNERLPENVAAKAARFIEPDSTDIQALFQDEDYLVSIGYTPETLMSMFIPNTYEFFWNTSPRGFVERMVKNTTPSGKRITASKKPRPWIKAPGSLHLASIVEKETLVNKEKPRMAGVYLNRLRTGMRLRYRPHCRFCPPRLRYAPGDPLSYQVRLSLQYLPLRQPAAVPHQHGFHLQHRRGAECRGTRLYLLLR
ncbi:MAG: endolytic transglycosylase MltG [Lewinellaceae bacterium]|nr:endolytic transglycosylase MltG [Lewinellaceae bacterium]